MFVVLLRDSDGHWMLCRDEKLDTYPTVDAAKARAEKYVKAYHLTGYKIFIINTDSHGSIVSSADKSEPPIVWR